MRMLLAFLLAVLVGAVLVSIANTHVVLGALAAVGAEIPAGVRFDAIQRDLVGFGPTLAVLVFIAFLVAFPTAGFVARILGPGWRRLGYTLAGGTAIAVMMLGITAVYGQILGATVTPVASSRELQGLLTLALGGAAAGFLFASLTPSAADRR
ncbi:hypothetical protein [Maricaulis sp. CAU 1757]